MHAVLSRTLLVQIPMTRVLAVLEEARALHEGEHKWIDTLVLEGCSMEGVDAQQSVCL